MTAGVSFSSYLSVSLHDGTRFWNGVCSVGLLAIPLGYLAIAIGAPVVILVARRSQGPPTLGATLLAGSIIGSIAPECIPWVWFLQGPLGSPLFFAYVLSGTIAGAVAATCFWLIAFRTTPPLAA